MWYLNNKTLHLKGQWSIAHSALPHGQLTRSPFGLQVSLLISSSYLAGLIDIFLLLHICVFWWLFTNEDTMMLIIRNLNLSIQSWTYLNFEGLASLTSRATWVWRIFVPQIKSDTLTIAKGLVWVLCQSQLKQLLQLGRSAHAHYAMRLAKEWKEKEEAQSSFLYRENKHCKWRHGNDDSVKKIYSVKRKS